MRRYLLQLAWPAVSGSSDSVRTAVAYGRRQHPGSDSAGPEGRRRWGRGGWEGQVERGGDAGGGWEGLTP